MAEGEGGTILGGGAGGQQQAAGGAWFDTFDDDTKGWVNARGYDKLDAAAVLPELVKGYRGAESKLGVPADQVLRLPGKDAKPEDWKQVWQKLGAPEQPDGYDFGEGLKDDKIAASFRAKAHEIGMPAPMAKAAAEWFMGESTAAREAAEAEWNAKADGEIAALKSAWGNDFDKNIDLAKRVARTMGINEQEAQQLERMFGLKRTAEMFSKFGGALGEHRFVGGQEGSGSFGMSAEAARQRIADLGKDSAWMAKYVGGDADSKAEWTRLHQIAFPEPQAA
jgi:hypothetical protein